MTVKLAVAQYGIGEGQGFEEAQTKALEYVQRAGEQKADLLVLPEMCNSPFYPGFIGSAENLPSGLETLPGPRMERMREAATDAGVITVAPMLEQGDDGSIFSSAAVLTDQGDLAGIYRRVHRDSGPHVQEQWLDTGDEFPVFPTRIGTLGVMIGHDVHFPEQSRILSLRGADILCVAGAGYGRHEETWELELRAHTVAHGVFLGAANRTGTQGDVSFFGQSQIVDPRAQILAEVDESDGIVTCECDLDEIREVRNLWQFFRDRRPETYEEMLEEAEVVE